MATMTEIETVRMHSRIRVEHPSLSSSKRLRASSRTATTSPSTTTTHKALTVNQDLKYSLTTIPRAQILAPNEVLLRTHTVGLNPIDWKTVSYNFCMPSLPWVNGRECSAIVEETGSAVRSIRKGQNVWTSTYYKDSRAGCFQDLVVVPEHTVVEVPRGLDMERAATLGVAGLTAGMVLWHWFAVGMGRPLSAENGFVLIWGG
jgi:NADPH:quinone reductase-like Zn-dependent oxidoreductase